MKIKVVFACLLLFSAISCTSDKGPLPTPATTATVSECNATISYSLSIAPIMATKCTTSGCHVSGDPNGDFTTYSGMKPHLVDGLIKSCVFSGNPVPMPLAGSPSLSTAQMDTLKCWLTQGYSDN